MARAFSSCDGVMCITQVRSRSTGGPRPVKASSGTFIDCVVPPMATVCAMAEGPMMAMTLWVCSSALALETAESGLDASSSSRISSCRPLMPPRALITFCASSTPSRSGRPATARPPVTDSRAPTR